MVSAVLTAAAALQNTGWTQKLQQYVPWLKRGSPYYNLISDESQVWQGEELDQHCPGTTTCCCPGSMPARLLDQQPRCSTCPSRVSRPPQSSTWPTPSTRSSPTTSAPRSCEPPRLAQHATVTVCCCWALYLCFLPNPAAHPHSLCQRKRKRVKTFCCRWLEQRGNADLNALAQQFSLNSTLRCLNESVEGCGLRRARAMLR